MRVWLVTIGEPMPIPMQKHERLHRTGMFATFLSAKGHDVTWWTSAFDHFRKRHLVEEDSVLTVTNGLCIRLIHGSGYRRNVSYARLRDHRQVAAKFASIGREEAPPDIIVAALPTIELSLASVNYGKEHRVPVVLDMRDMWPDIYVDHAPPLARSLVRFTLYPMFRSAHLACARATAIIGITDAFVDWGLKRGGRQRSELDRSFPFAYSQCPPKMEECAKAEAKWDNLLGVRSEDDFLNICFFGSVNRQFDLGTAIAAVRTVAASGGRVRLVICGTGEQLQKYKAMASGSPNVVFPGWVNAADIYTLMRRSCAGIDPMPNRYDFLGTINNKAIEYMSAGLLVIASPDRGVLHNLLTDEQCGLTYPCGDVGSLVDLLQRLVRDRDLCRGLSGNATRVFAERFAANRVCQDMMEHLEIVVDKTGGRT